MALMLGEPIWMMAPKHERMAAFVWSILSLSSFTAQVVYVIFSYFQGNTPFDSYAEIVSLYILVLRAADVIPSAYTVLYEGMGQNEYSLFNPNYGNWQDVIVRQAHSVEEQSDEYYHLEF
jgi:hypothetical protein